MYNGARDDGKLTCTKESYFTYSADQESLVDHDVHWRPGIGADGTETFMPRTVIYDLKGGFGSMRKINALYDPTEAGASAAPAPQGLWNTPAVVQRETPIEPSAYQASLDAGTAPPALTAQNVRYWSDFSRVYYHPRSVVQLHEYELHSALMPFERWDSGEDLFRSLDREHDLLDRDLRPFVEEADQMQGLQVFASWDDAWGGFAGQYLERLRDEYGKTPIWAWGLHDPAGGGRGVPREKRLLRLANKARAMVDAYRQASTVVPLALPSSLPRSLSSLDGSSAWHWTGLLATALDSATLPTRLKDRANRDTLGGMGDLLNTMGKQSMAGLQMSFKKSPDEDDVPAGRTDHRERQVSPSDEEDEAGAGGVRLDLDFSPSDQLDPAPARQNGYHHQQPRIFSQAVTWRGPGELERKDEEDDGEELDPRESNRLRGANEPASRKYVYAIKDASARYYETAPSRGRQSPPPLSHLFCLVMPVCLLMPYLVFSQILLLPRLPLARQLSKGLQRRRRCASANPRERRG